MKHIIFIIGVSGCGKSTIGKLLSKTLDIPFFDGDNFHPQSNIDKMASGHSLNDDDRREWLISLNTLSKNQITNQGAIIACSALKESYRELLSDSIKKHTTWVHLEGSKELILERMKTRDHFMPISLLDSQFETLEVPDYGLHLSIIDSPETIITSIIKQFNL